MCIRLLALLFYKLFHLESFRIGHLEYAQTNETDVLDICIGNSSQHTIISLPSCRNFNGLENAANLNYQYNVDLFVGAGCDDETETVSRLALRWQKLYFSSAALSIKEKENTTIALKPNSLKGTAKVIIAMCQSMNWKEIGFVYSPTNKPTAHSIFEAMINDLNNNIIINHFIETDGLRNINVIVNTARVLIAFLDRRHLGNLVKSIKDYAHRPLEFTIIQVNLNRTKPHDFYNYLDAQASFESNPITTARLRKMHRHIVFLHNIHKDRTSTFRFGAVHGFEPTHSLYKSLILCDGLQLLNGFQIDNKKSKVDEFNRLWNYVTNREVPGNTGPLFIGVDGVRLPYYHLFMWREFESIRVALIQPLKRSECHNNSTNCYEMIRINETEENYLDELPPYLSDCGFDYSICSETHVFVIAGIILIIILIPLLIALYLQRKEHQIMKMAWRVSFEDLSFVEPNEGEMTSRKETRIASRQAVINMRENGMRGTEIAMISRRTSTLSSQRISGLSIFAFNSCEHAYYNKSKVSLKRYPQRHAITFSRDEMGILNELKYMSHTNINTFIGVCFNQASELMIMWSFAPRYSLDDLIFVKEQKFGRNFQSTFIKHILSGLNYIHNSSIKVHGRLFLTNCVVDSYWVVKLTDFGYRDVLRDKFVHKDVLSIEGFDVESINTKYLQMAPELLEIMLDKRDEPTGTVEGDIYQLAMLIYQILFYVKPFSNRMESCQELAQVIAKSDKHLRPTVPEGTCFTMRLLSIIQQCWLQKPTARPNLNKIVDAVNREFGQDVKGGLIDQMIEMVDEYSANLEKIVSERTVELENQIERTENLLYQLLPKSMADKIRDGRTVSPIQHPSVTLLVVDICQFTKFCEAFIPIHILETLQELYSSFDYIVQKNKAFKVENVGDAYLICCGLFESKNESDHLRDVCKTSLKLLSFMSSFQVKHRRDYKLDIKMGISTGAVASGILGSIAPRFCIFGDSVNMACRMASTCLPNKIQISELTGYAIKEKYPLLQLEERGMVDVKGKGPCLTFWLIGENNLMKKESSRSSQIKFEDSSEFLNV